jgi:probable poly-beta-1,6-N-acetyl-D-glucosamine export protein
VPFVFVAGFLFQYRLAKFKYGPYLLAKLKYVVLPYFLISLPYIALQKIQRFGIFADWYPRWTDSDLLHVAATYINGNQMPIPLWFVPMICVYFLLAPLFLLLDRYPKSYALIPLLLLFASFLHRPVHQTYLLQTSLYFLPTYVAGMWTSHYREQVLPWVRRTRWWLLALVAALVTLEVTLRERSGAIESVSLFSTERGLVDVNLTLKLLASWVLLDALRDAATWLHKALAPLADMSFGIFFIHYYFIYIARESRYAWATAPWAGSFLNLSLYTLALLALSMALIGALRKALGARSRYLVGS